MAVQKINGFAAPYRSDTFQKQVNAQTGRNGVLKMSASVTQSGGTVTVPPLTFVQAGLVVSKDVATTLTAPSMQAPYYLAVTALTPSQVDDLQFTFAKTPRDLTVGDVIVASYDGLEWRQPQLLAVDGVYADEGQGNIDFGRVGPFSGLLTTVVGSNYQNTAGVLVDQTGLRQHLYVPALFPTIATDPDYSRVDRIVYRRPADSVNRIGVRRFLVGGTYASSPATSHSIAAFFDNSAPRPVVKFVIGSDNAVHAFAATGYGSTFSLAYRKLSADRSTVLVATTTLFTMTDKAFAVTIDLSNNLHVTYVNNSQIYYRKFGPTGTSLVSATRVDSQSTPSAAPTIAVDPANTKVFILYQSLLGASNNQVFFTTRDLNGNQVTAPKNLTGNASNLQNPSIHVTDDLWVYVAWEDTTLTKIYYQIFDDIGAALSSSVWISGATTRIGFGTLVDGAKTPKIRVTDNKSVFVTFLQDKGGSVFGLSVWNDGSAFMQQLLASGENFTTYAVTVDSVFNGVHLSVARSTSIDYVKLEGQTVLFTLNLSGAAASSVAIGRDTLGSMYHLWSSTLAATFTVYKTNVTVQNIGPVTLTGSVTPTVVVSSSQYVVLTSAFTSPVPAVGDQVVITGSSFGNNGTHTIAAISTISLNASNDRYLIQIETPFAATESPATGVKSSFAEPDGNAAAAVKSTSELQSLAYRFSALSTDLLLSRIGMPGANILGYLTADRPGLDANALLAHGSLINIDWGKTTVGSLTTSGGLKILDMVHNVDYTLADGSFVMADGTALFVLLDGSNTSPTPQVLPLANVPWATSIAVLGAIKDGVFNPTALLTAAGLGQLSVGELDVIGEDLPLSQRLRLGITSETAYEAYSSTIVIAANDSHPTALSKLDAQVGALENNHPLEDEFAGDGVTATPTFTTAVSGLSWSTSASVYDLVVWVDGRRLDPWPGSGSFLSRHFRKLSVTSFQVGSVVRSGSVVRVRKEGSSYGGPAAPSGGKLWSDQVDHNIVGPDAAFDVGASANRMRNGYFANMIATQYSVPSAVIGNLILVKAKTNGDIVTLAAGYPVSLGADGKIYLADANATNGQKGIGISLDTIAPAGQGRILLFGYNVPGVLTSLGFSPGDEVYVSETGTYTNGATGLSGASDTFMRIGFADCADATALSAATDLILAYQTIASAP